jgi:hypothetical protein
MTDKAQQLLGKNPPISPQEFHDKLWTLRTEGNVEDTYITVCFTIRNEKDFYGNAVTLEKIVEKYKQYLALCKKEERPDRYIKLIRKFVLDGGYNTEFSDTNEAQKKRYL